MNTPSQPTKEQLQTSAYRLLSQMVMAGGGKQPSDKALAIAACSGALVK